ncbi:MAG: glycosyltransferase [Pseudomonadota bacterium]
MTGSPRTALANKRIVVAGEFWHGAPAKGFASGFRALGCDVIEIDVNHFLPLPHTTSLRITSRILARQLKKNYNDFILSVCRTKKIDVFFQIKGNGVSYHTLDLINKINVETALFYPDVDFNHPGVRLEKTLLNKHIFSTKKFHKPFFQETYGREIVHLNHGYSPAVHRPCAALLDEAGFAWDISYVGNPSPYKLRWLISVVSAFPDKRIKIIGNNWLKIGKGTAIEPYLARNAVTGDALADVIETSKINLAFHYGPAGTHGWQDSISARTFQIPASRGFMLHVDNAEIRDLFSVPDEIDVFEGPDDLNEKIAYYLENPVIRQQMNQKAHKRCVPAYSLDARARAIIAQIDNIRS